VRVQSPWWSFPRGSGRDVSASPRAKNLKFPRHTAQNWDKLPIRNPQPRVYPNAQPGRHRPQNPRRTAIRRPHHHAAARRQGRPVGLALSSPRKTSGAARRDHALIATVDQKSLGLHVSVFISIKLARQKEEDLNRFAKAISKWDEVLECYLMTGNRDYLLRVVAAVLSSYEAFLKNKLTRLDGIASIVSSFALSQVKYSAALPV
jgi:DNA-binding Lrp family transcriptional regulator